MYNQYIRPEVLNILGYSQETSPQSPTVQAVSAQGQTWWDRIKSKVKEIFGYIGQALNFIKDNVVPIATATADILNAWANYQRYTGNRGYATCAA